MAFLPLCEANGNPVIQHLEVKNLRLASGRLVDAARLGYCVFGNPTAPIVVLHTAVSGNPRAFATEVAGYGDGWWSRHFGPGAMFDTRRHRIVCVSHLGGNGPSSSADELATLRSELSIIDTCEITARALSEQGIDRIHAAVGVSMGAPIARAWLLQRHVKLKKIIEIFGNFGNNHVGAVAKDYCHIQIDLLHSRGDDLDEILDRIEANCGRLRDETAAFRMAYDHVLEEYKTLHSDFSDENVLRVTRMIGFFRFVTPHYFQEKWDAAYNRSHNSADADAQIRNLCDQLGRVFVKSFRRSSLGSLRYMDAQPKPMNPAIVAQALIDRDIEILGLIVRGDRLYQPELQFGHYQAVRAALPEAERSRLRIHMCTNLLRGHDHFLSEEFRAEGKTIASFLDGADEC
jgi:homoserine acetyltransferase